MRISYKWLVLLTTFSAIGLISSALVLYLFYTLHITPPLCKINGYSPLPGVTIDCIRVLTSEYSEVLGIPLDVLAAIWFIINITLVLAYAYVKDDMTAFRCLRALRYWRFLGVLVVPYLIYIEFVVLKAICVYCTIMHAAILIDFALISIYIRRFIRGH